MSAIEQIRAIREVRGSAEYGQYVPFNTTPEAILELAERLRLLEGDVRELAGKLEEPCEPEPFRVDRDGVYANRHGQEVFVKMDAEPCGDFVARAIYDPRFNYRHDGRLFSEREEGEDLVACLRPLAAERPEARRITGWVNLIRSKYPTAKPRIQCSVLFSTEAEANAAPSAAKRIACIYIDCAEGDGIERGDGT